METQRTFQGPDGTSVTGYDQADQPARPLQPDVLDLIQGAPAYLTPAERLFLFTFTYATRPNRYLEIGVL